MLEVDTSASANNGWLCHNEGWTIYIHHCLSHFVVVGCSVPVILCRLCLSEININSMWPCDITWWHRSGSTLAQVMACCLMATSHYLNQCWLIINEFCGIHMRAFFKEILKISKILPHFPGANKLNSNFTNCPCQVVQSFSKILHRMYSVTVMICPITCVTHIISMNHLEWYSVSKE